MSKPDPSGDERLSARLDEALAQLRAGGDPTELSGKYPDLGDLLGMVHSIETAVADLRDTSPDSAADLEPVPKRVGRYEILRRLGSGGMGTVYQARDPNLDRCVALKVPHFDRAAPNRQAASQRFLREARAAAHVRHAHVCPVHDVGEHDGVPFAVLAFIEGQDLDAWARQGPRDVRQAVELVRKAALGLQAVHDQGIIHRDLKPSNILLDAHGEPLLTDFGLARLVEDSERLTKLGTIVGTPSYMAPEQANSEVDQLGPHTDVYSLGVVLYRLLTGRPPFEGPLLTVLYRINHEEMPIPSLLRPGLDPKLETILKKATSKKPGDRYGSAREFADALGCWLAGGDVGEGVTAPAAQDEEVSTTSYTSPRRLRLVWVAVAAGLLAMVGGGLLAQWVIRVKDKDGKVVAEVNLPEGGGIEVVPAKAAVPPKNPPPLPFGEPMTPRSLVARPVAVAGVKSWTVETRQPRGAIQALAYRPDGAVLAAGGEDHSIRLWDVATGRLVGVLASHGGRIRVLSWSPDGQYLASSAQHAGRVRIWHVATGKDVRYLPADSPGAVAWSPDSKRLAYHSTGEVRLWDVANGKVARALKAGSHTHLAWSPDGKSLITGGDDSVTIWDPETGQSQHTFRQEKQTLCSLAWLRGDRIAAHYRDSLVLWSPTGKKLGEHKAGPLPEGCYHTAVWSADSSAFAEVTVSTGVVVRELGKPDPRFRHGTTGLEAAAWSPDRRTIACGNVSGRIVLLDAATGQVRALTGSMLPVMSVAVSPDGGRVAVVNRDAGMPVWNLDSAAPEYVHPTARRAAWSPDGKLLAVENVNVDLLDTTTWLPTAKWAGVGPRGIAWSPDGATLAACRHAPVITLWDVKARRERLTLHLPKGQKFASSVAWSHDGKRVAASGFGCWVWDATTGERLHEIAGQFDGALALSPRDNRGVYGAGSLFSLDDGTATRLPFVNIGGAAWSPDGRRLAATAGNAPTLFDPATRKTESFAHGTAHTAVSLSWSANGTTLATGAYGREGSVWVWDVAARRPRGVLLMLSDGRHLAISAEGHYKGFAGIEKEIVYIVETDAGRETLNTTEFAAKHGWKNDPDRVRLR